MTSTHSISPELTSILEKTADFHGHLGPFLVIGVRAGLVGLNRVGITIGDTLVVTASVPIRIPFSCILDGLQISTNCTVGNQRLSVRNSDEIQLIFERKGNGRKVVVALNRSTFSKLKSQLLQENLSDQEVRELAWKVASIPEDELFILT